MVGLRARAFSIFSPIFYLLSGLLSHRGKVSVRFPFLLSRVRARARAGTRARDISLHAIISPLTIFQSPGRTARRGGVKNELKAGEGVPFIMGYMAQG